MTQRRFTRGSGLPAVLLAALLAVLVVSGCSTDDTAAPAEPGSGSASASVLSDSDLVAAAETALAEFDRGTLFAIERVDAGWEARVVNRGGTTNTLTVSSDASAVTAGPTAADQDMATRAQQRAFARTISVDYAGAVRSAREAIPEGQVVAVELDESDGIRSWDVVVDAGADGEQTVVVNAGTGDVLQVLEDQ